MRGRPGARRRLPVIVGAVLALAACTTSSPTLLDASDFEGVQKATHDTDGYYAPGWTWCRPLSPSDYYRPAPTSHLLIGDRTEVGATIIDRSADGMGADSMLSALEDKAALCEDGFGAGDGDVIEPLRGLDDDTVGWRTQAGDGERGEFVVTRLDDRRLLAVGFSTYDDADPVAIGDLIRLAREGAARLSDGT